MKGELKKRAAEVTPNQIGFVTPGMVQSTRERKHVE
jgi:transitional endoplasmic reticulum ATPase